MTTPPFGSVVCKVCKGTGITVHLKRRCEACDGTGWIKPKGAK